MAGDRAGASYIVPVVVEPAQGGVVAPDHSLPPSSHCRRRRLPWHDSQQCSRELTDCRCSSAAAGGGG